MAPDAQKVAFQKVMSSTDIVLDCVFGEKSFKLWIYKKLMPIFLNPGFSYKPPVRAPFGFVLEEFKKTTKPILSCDIPSGWEYVSLTPATSCSKLTILPSLQSVERGNVEGEGFTPGEPTPADPSSASILTDLPMSNTSCPHFFDRS